MSPFRKASWSHPRVPKKIGRVLSRKSGPCYPTADRTCQVSSYAAAWGRPPPAGSAAAANPAVIIKIINKQALMGQGEEEKREAPAAQENPWKDPVRAWDVSLPSSFSPSRIPAKGFVGWPPGGKKR